MGRCVLGDARGLLKWHNASGNNSSAQWETWRQYLGVIEHINTTTLSTVTIDEFATRRANKMHRVVNRILRNLEANGSILVGWVNNFTCNLWRSLLEERWGAWTLASSQTRRDDHTKQNVIWMAMKRMLHANIGILQARREGEQQMTATCHREGIPTLGVGTQQGEWRQRRETVLLALHMMINSLQDIKNWRQKKI